MHALTLRFLKLMIFMCVATGVQPALSDGIPNRCTDPEVLNEFTVRAGCQQGHPPACRAMLLLGGSAYRALSHLAVNDPKAKRLLGFVDTLRDLGAATRARATQMTDAVRAAERDMHRTHGENWRTPERQEEFNRRIREKLQQAGLPEPTRDVRRLPLIEEFERRVQTEIEKFPRQYHAEMRALAAQQRNMSTAMIRRNNFTVQFSLEGVSDRDIRRRATESIQDTARHTSKFANEVRTDADDLAREVLRQRNGALLGRARAAGTGVGLAMIESGMVIYMQERALESCSSISRLSGEDVRNLIRNEAIPMDSVTAVRNDCNALNLRPDFISAAIRDDGTISDGICRLITNQIERMKRDQERGFKLEPSPMQCSNATVIIDDKEFGSFRQTGQRSYEFVSAQVERWRTRMPIRPMHWNFSPNQYECLNASGTQADEECLRIQQRLIGPRVRNAREQIFSERNVCDNGRTGGELAVRPFCALARNQGPLKQALAEYASQCGTPAAGSGTAQPNGNVD